MEKLSRNRLFPFHSVRCLKYFAKQDVHLVLIRYALYKNGYHQYIVKMLCWV